MDTHEQNLSDLVSHSLHEMAWRRGYRINPNIATFCFLQAFKEHGFFVSERQEHTFTFNDRILGTLYSLQSQVSQQEILAGWNDHPIGSPHALYDSIYIVMDKMDKDLTQQEREYWEQNGKRFARAKNIRQTMEQHLVDNFEKYQEKLLLNADGTAPKLKEPEIFKRVLKDYPMHLYKAAQHVDAHRTPLPECLLEMNWEFDDDYYPSVAVMEDYFWGHYLNELVKEKGYPHNDQMLKRLCALGWNGMPEGRTIWRQA